MMRHLSFNLSQTQLQPEYLCVYFLDKTISSQIANNNSQTQPQQEY